MLAAELKSCPDIVPVTYYSLHRVGTVSSPGIWSSSPPPPVPWLRLFLHVTGNISLSFVPGFPAQMQKDSSPSTGECPVQPYLTICGVSQKAVPQQLEQSRGIQGQQGDVKLDLGGVCLGEVDLERRMQG